MSGRQLARRLNELSLPGVRFVPIRFTPNASKYANKPCEGVNIIVIDRSVFSPVEVGLQTAAILRDLYPDQWDTKRLNRLLISKRIFHAIIEGADAKSLNALYRGDLAKFLERREQFLLYR